MKRTLLLVMSFLMLQSVMADDYTYLNVQKTDGTGVSLGVDNLSITFSDGYFVAGDTRIALSDLSKMFFSDDEFDNQTSYESITVGDTGKSTYCGDKSLDFSDVDDLKAFVATGYDKDNGIIWLTRVTKVPANTPLLLKGEANTYEVPVSSSSVSCYYPNMLVGNLEASLSLGETDEDGSYLNYYLKDGQFVSVSNYAVIGQNKCYLRLPAVLATSVTGASQSVTLSSTGKSTYAPPVDLDFTDVEDLKAFTATGYDENSQTLWLSRVNRVQAGEGILLKGNAGETYTIPSSAVQASYMNMFVGNNSGAQITINATSDDNEWINYYLKDGQFVSVNGNATVNNSKAYLQLPASIAAATRSEKNESGGYDVKEFEMDKISIAVRSIDGNGSTVTGISSIQNENGDMTNGDDAWYNLQGQRVKNPGKGVFIHNGKKVVIQ